MVSSSLALRGVESSHEGLAPAIADLLAREVGDVGDEVEKWSEKTRGVSEAHLFMSNP